MPWISGKAQLPPASFHHLKRDTDLFSSAFQALAEDQYGFLWFGSFGGGGLYRYDGYELRSFLTDPSRMESTVSSPRIHSIYGQMDSLIFMGGSFGFTLLNPFTGKVRNFNNNYEEVPDVRIGGTLSFLDDTIRDVFWIGTRYGLARFDTSDGSTFTMLRPEEPVDGRFMPEDVTRILIQPDDPNVLWLATYNGLFMYSIVLHTYTHFACTEMINQQMTITDLFRDTAGMLWMSTREGYVVSFNITSRQWRVYPIPASDPSSTARKDVYKIMPGGDDLLWISTHTSVGRLHTETGHFDSWQYNPELPEGLLPNGTYLDLLHDRHGRLWIGSWHGIQFARNAFVPRSTVVTDLKVAITDVDISPAFDDDVELLMYSGVLHLHKEQRDVTFHFVLPNPLDRSAVTYQYMLSGYDNDWITTDQRRVRYARLGGGKYSFMVRAREGDAGAWVPVTDLELHIPKRISENWWFWGSLLALICLGAILLYRFLISRAIKEQHLKAEFEHKLSEIQMQALRAQMNPHFLFNSLNSIKYYAISKSKDETAAYLSKFALLVRAILNNSKSQTISLKDELDALKLYIEIEHMRLEGKFDYLVDIDSSIHIGQAQIPPMILQPYVENAIWHGLMHKEGAGRLLVQVKDLGNQIQCIIEDNGIGRARSAEIRKTHVDHKHSVGMQITGNRIALINRIYGIDTQVQVIDLQDAEGNPAGTRVVINIPLIRDEEE